MKSETTVFEVAFGAPAVLKVPQFSIQTVILEACALKTVGAAR